MLENISSKLSNIKTVYRLSDALLTANTLKNEFVLDMPSVNFVSFMAQKIAEDKELMQPGTYGRYNAIYHKLKGYRKEIPFAAI